MIKLVVEFMCGYVHVQHLSWVKLNAAPPPPSLNVKNNSYLINKPCAPPHMLPVSMADGGSGAVGECSLPVASGLPAGSSLPGSSGPSGGCTSLEGQGLFGGCSPSS